MENGVVVHRLAPKSRIQVDVVHGSIQVNGNDGDECQVVGRYPSHLDRHGQDPIADGVLRVNQVGGGLVISAERTRVSGGLLGRFVGGGPPAVDVTIDAPSRSTIAITSVRADVTTTGLIHDQAIRTVTGDVIVTGAAGSVKVQGVSGRIGIQGDVLAPNVSTTSGHVTVRADRIGGTRIDTVSGDVRLEGRLDATGEHRVNTINGDLVLDNLRHATVSVRGVSGSIRLEGPARREDDGKGHRRVVVGDGRAHIAFQTVSGDLTIRAAAQDARVPDSASGDQGGLQALLEALERGEIDVDEASRRLEVTHG